MIGGEFMLGTINRKKKHTIVDKVVQPSHLPFFKSLIQVSSSAVKQWEGVTFKGKKVFIEYYGRRLIVALYSSHFSIDLLKRPLLEYEMDSSSSDSMTTEDLISLLDLSVETVQ